jgi:predicted HAD superfamily Cof-like phosphohydrolase
MLRLSSTSKTPEAVSIFSAAMGWPLDEALDRVFESNMSKLVDGKPVKNEFGKVIKPPHYHPPYLTDLI